MKDDDEDEENTFGVTRYPCMPSLVALQQMRNRLHLAYLGRKLMKWTMLATGRELRRIAGELDGLYKGFGEDLRNAFILLARSRYFCPELNKMVLEDIAKQPGVIVIPTAKAVSGVKLMNFEIQETDAKPYPHLGIEKGGQTILETKKAWLEILKRLIMMLQLRTSFLTVELSNKAATKKMNVMQKIVIPRTNVTVSYILSELEEMAREEFHRLKKVKEKKSKGSKKKDSVDNDGLCPVCIDKLTDVQESPKKPSSPEVKEVLKQTETQGSEYTSRSVSTISQIDLPQPDIKLEYIKQHINELIVLGKSFIESGVEYIDVEEFIRICEKAKEKMEEIFVTDTKYIEEHTDEYNTRLDDFKSHLREVIVLAKNLKEKTTDPSVDQFIQTCEEVDEKINKEIPTSKTSGKSRLEKLDDHISDVVKITNEYKKQGLLSPSVEEFMNSCKAIKLKIKEYSEQESKADKILHLKSHIGDLEMLTNEVKSSGLASRSIEHFSASCKDFKKKLDGYAKHGRKDIALNNLLEQIDKTIGMSMEAKDIGLVGDSIEDFVKSSEKLKEKIVPVKDTKSKILNSLKINITDVMSTIKQYKEEGLVSKSVEDFLKSCEATKSKIEKYEFVKPKPASLEPTCSGTCISCNEPVHTEIIIPTEGAEVCKSCHRLYRKEQLSLTPCASCTDEMKEVKTPSDTDVCQTCSITETPRELLDIASQTSEPLPVDEKYCDVCKKNVIGSHNRELSAVDSKESYFERKIKKLTKVTRSQNPDGTIREETESISIRKVKRTPTDTSLDDDDDDDDDYIDSYSSEDKTQVALCILSNHNQYGFIKNRSVKSEMGFKTSQIIATGLRSCISVGTLSAYYNNGSQ